MGEGKTGLFIVEAVNCQIKSNSPSESVEFNNEERGIREGSLGELIIDEHAKISEGLTV